MEYWHEKARKHMCRWTGRRDMTEKLLKTALSPNHSIILCFLQRFWLASVPVYWGIRIPPAGYLWENVKAVGVSDICRHPYYFTGYTVHRRHAELEVIILFGLERVALLTPLSYIWQICSRRHWKHLLQTWKISRNIGIITEKKLKNIVSKGEIARLEQFLLLSQYFQKLSAADASKCFYRW